MLFHEIYGSYYNTVAAVIGAAQSGTLSQKELSRIISEKAFGESILSIPDNLADESWPFLRKDLTTPIEHTPATPLTTVQKQWMKAVCLDPRIQLFQPDMTGLDDVEPLFTPDTFVYYDRYSNHDPFEDAQYIAHFRTILTAMKEKRYIRVQFRGHLGTRHNFLCIPYKLEYSPKDDKFRLLTAIDKQIMTINLSRIRSCRIEESYPEEEYQPVNYREKSIVFDLTDDRNALERVMLHFSDLEKETVKLDDTHYRVTLYYKRDDETELVIRILSFGSVLRVISPSSFIHLLNDRIRKQEFLLHRESNPA